MRVAIKNNLLTWTDVSPVHRHVAYLLAGWASLFFLLPPGHRPPPLKMRDIAIGSFILAMFFVFAGMFLNSLAPVFRMLGQLSTLTLVSLVFVAFNAHRYYVGRRALRLEAISQVIQND